MKNLNDKLIIICFVLAIFAAKLDPTYADESANKSSQSTEQKIESLLDSAEIKLMPPSSNSNSEKKSDKTTAQQTLGGERPTSNKNTNTSRVKNLNEIQSKIQEYDHRIEILEADLSRLQASLQNYAATDNLVQISAKSSGDESFIVRGLTVKLNGRLIYDQLAPSGLWMPSKSITLFQGPLPPGTHRLDVVAVTSPLEKNGLKLPSSQHKLAEQTLSIIVPEGKSRKTFLLDITGSDKSTQSPSLKIDESQTP